MDTQILAGNKVFMVADSDPKPARKPRAAKIDPEPKMPEGLQERMRISMKRGEAFTDADYAAFQQYKADHEAWVSRMAKKGRGYQAHSVWTMEREAHELLMEWLKMVASDTPVLTLAEGVRSLTYAYLVYGNHWENMPDNVAAHVGEYMALVRQAMQEQREIMDAIKHR